MLETTPPSHPCAGPQRENWVSVTAPSFSILASSPSMSRSVTWPGLFLLCLSSGSDGWRLYEYITRHFIATVSQDCKYLQTTIDFSIGPEAFSCSGKTLISAGTGQPSQGLFYSSYQINYIKITFTVKHVEHVWTVKCIWICRKQHCILSHSNYNLNFWSP